MTEHALLLAAALSAVGRADPASDFSAGVEAEHRGDLRSAVGWLDRAQRNAPKWGLAKLELAEVLLDEGGEPDRVLALLNDARGLEPRNPRLYHLWGEALMEKGSAPGAETSERMALSLRPDYPEAENTLGEALWAQGRREEALQCWRDLSGRHPNDTAMRALLVDRLLDDGKGVEAEKQLRVLIADQPRNPIWHRRLARTLDAEGLEFQAAAERRVAEDLSGRTEKKRKLRRLPDSRR